MPVHHAFRAAVAAGHAGGRARIRRVEDGKVTRVETGGYGYGE